MTIIKNHRAQLSGAALLSGLIFFSTLNVHAASPQLEEAQAKQNNAAAFDLWEMTSDDKVMIAVTTHNNPTDKAKGASSVISVASGTKADALDLLGDQEATTSIASLRAEMDSHNIDRVLSNFSTTDKKRLKIIQKETVKELDQRGSGHEVIVVKTKDENGDMEIETTGDVDLDDPAIQKLLSEETSSIDTNADKPSSARKRVIQTSENGIAKKIAMTAGVTAARARDFIEQADGLTDQERAAMLKTLDL